MLLIGSAALFAPWQLLVIPDSTELFWVIPIVLLLVAVLIIVPVVIRGELRSRRRWRRRLAPLPQDSIEMSDGIPVVVILIFLLPIPISFVGNVLVRGSTLQGAAIAALSGALLAGYCVGLGWTITFTREVVERIWKLPGTR